MLATMGVAWIGVARVAGIDIELPAIGAALTTFAGGLHILRTERLHFTPYYVVYLALTFLICVALAVRGDSGMAIVAVRNLVYILATLCLYNMLDTAQLRSPRMFLAIVGGIAICVLYSAIAAEIDILDGIIGAISGQYAFQYVNFNFWRPLFNFHSNSLDTLGYAVSSVNQISRAVSVAVALLLISRAPLSPSGTAVVAVAVATLAINSTAYLLFLLTLAFCLFAIFVYRSAAWALTAGLVGLIVALTVVDSGFVDRILAGDIYSRSSRIAQYLGSLSDIDSSILLGSSLTTYGGHVVHNFFLFSGLTLGLPGLVLASALYILVLRLAILHCMQLMKTGDRMSAFVVLCCTIFLIRITFGGAGGFADLPSHAAMAFAMIAHREMRTATDPVPAKDARKARRGRRSFSAT
ncbi:hypothetical protein [Pontivivens ytuae]|uniref:O-Antigen ligase n=1 Tax=Pontivivens ytuae TaxID=2789856 RepID=A0A7S9LV89_9RHOB|nr:hypothetical protein [Pontivivens ytuae]QPH55951.1 hypothetical protein I0K15_09580 [Pontivivens ytuae]